VIITGGIDLSVGTMMTVSAVATGIIITNMELPIWLGIIVGILTGTLGGLLNGVLIARLKIPPFIATLGTLYIAKGLALVASGLKPIYFNDTPRFNEIAMDSIIPVIEIPNIVLIFFFVAYLSHLLLTKTTFGRYTFALGSNEEAARLSGVNVDKWKIWVYVFGGATAGLAGVLISARLNSAQPSLGMGYELEAIAAVVIGGTSLRGGEGKIIGTVIGALVISTLTNGLRVLSVPQEWQTVVTGAIVILAVYLDIVRRRREAVSSARQTSGEK
jgi:ribose transport system permease protein